MAPRTVGALLMLASRRAPSSRNSRQRARARHFPDDVWPRTGCDRAETRRVQKLVGGHSLLSMHHRRSALSWAPGGFRDGHQVHPVAEGRSVLDDNALMSVLLGGLDDDVSYAGFSRAVTLALGRGFARRCGNVRGEVHAVRYFWATASSRRTTSAHSAPPVVRSQRSEDSALQRRNDSSIPRV